MRTVDTAFLEIMFRLVVNMRVVQHGFRGYAPDIETSASKAATLLYTCSLSKLRPIRRQCLSMYREKYDPNSTFNPS